MDSRACILRLSIAYLSLLMLISTLFPLCDAINHGRGSRSSSIKSWKKLKSQNRLNKFSSFEYSDIDSSYGSPSSLALPPYYNPLAPQPTSLPPYSLVPNPPHDVVGPPSPKIIVTTPPPPSPPKHVPSPPKSVISPPNVYPPPPPSPLVNHKKPPQYAIWCVAKPTVPDPMIQLAMDYACGSGADCKSIQPNGSCFQPNTLLAHASYAFNSYWQKTKNGGGTCDFGGIAMLVTVDPSYDKCSFMLT
ncbi:uncharacterized protein [Cicer arietinum]|uniref:Sulfated surface glycoprotein 185-like n=1 Tax=Cicer arietinum TaxID=3827 RepID=A0A1S2YAV2_CICAR|nr:sulfated surface glycoprotein 185-like [Cicer arietinum]